MSRDANPLVDGVVVNQERTHFVVELSNGAKVKCKLSGNMRRNTIAVTIKDRVQIRVGSYDLSNGIIVYRYK